MRRVATLVLLSSLLLGATGGDKPAVEITDAKDQQILAGFLKHAVWMPTFLTADRCKRDTAKAVPNLTWQQFPMLRCTLTAYRLTGDTEHLQRFVATFENMRAALVRGPDGYLGWYGKTFPLMQDPADPDKKVQVVINAFRATEVLTEFIAETDRSDQLKRKYAKQRRQYLDLVENHLVRQWHARTRYVDLGTPGAVYRSQDGLSETRSRLTLPHNMHSIVVDGLLGLYRVTGKDEYMRRAIKLGTRFKRCLTLKDGHYEWNYWDPAGAWDVHPSKPKAWKHWIGAEHTGHYYSASLSLAVALYHHGVVFSRKDIDRFLKTQLEVVWNGNVDEPKWTKVDGTTTFMAGDYICPALAPFDKKIHAFVYTGQRQQQRVDGAAHTWQGGPVAEQWFRGKYLTGPAATGGRQIYLEHGQRFLAKPANRAFTDALKVEVAAASYKAPGSPEEMKPMPPEPGRPR